MGSMDVEIKEISKSGTFSYIKEEVAQNHPNSSVAPGNWSDQVDNELQKERS